MHSIGPDDTAQADAELVGGHDAAKRLEDRTGLKVRKWDIEVLVEDGRLPIHSCYQNSPLYRSAAVDAIPADLVKPIVDARLARFAQSVYINDAPAYLGVTLHEFIELANQHALTVDEYRRIPRTELEPLRRTQGA